MKPEFTDAQGSFKEAIDQGRLSSNQNDPNYAGDYMYMGYWDGVAQFKNIITRKYDV